MKGLKRIYAGLIIGLIGSVLLTLLLLASNSLDIVGGQETIPYLFVTGLIIGVALAYFFQPTDDGFFSDALKGMIVSILAWVVLVVNLYPTLMNQSPMWQSDYALDSLPQLVAYLLLGAVAGALYRVVFRLLDKRIDSSSSEQGQSSPIQTRIVIIGGGYAGVAAAERLELEFKHDPTVGIWLISRTNYLLHTPMLSEVSASTVDARHISPSLRSAFYRVQIVQGMVEGIDMMQRTIQLQSDERSTKRTLEFDHLVIAAGSVPNFFGNEEIAQNSFSFKSLEDAELLRNQMIDMFERADNLAEDHGVEEHPEQEDRRHCMLTFVVAGGGFAGVELIGSINDFARGMLPFYPNLIPEDIRPILVHSRDRILPELSTELGHYAQKKLTLRGVDFVLNTRVVGAQKGRIQVKSQDGETSIGTETFIWTAGNRPSPIVEMLGVSLTNRGQLEVDETLAVPGLTNVWAVGDCAQVPDAYSASGYAPPTAQHALREGKIVGQNVAASIRGKKLKKFDFKTIGSLAALGHQVAVAEIMGVRFSGFLAWMMWRGIYLSKLPTLEKQVRVGIDWFVDIFFPPDIVQTIDFSRAERELENK
ncbi:NAD(P)/FAD-dependent oxidoreductase [Chloroflexi bacterium TSY]|nr:NAD(P)/FAD-dependent oxidoreductase [Chloroflexi bacterium TSY]